MSLNEFFFSRNVLLVDRTSVKLCVPCIAHTRLLHFYAFDFFFPFIVGIYSFVCFVTFEISFPVFNNL